MWPPLLPLSSAGSASPSSPGLRDSSSPLESERRGSAPQAAGCAGACGLGRPGHAPPVAARRGRVRLRHLGDDQRQLLRVRRGSKLRATLCVVFARASSLAHTLVSLPARASPHPLEHCSGAAGQRTAQRLSCATRSGSRRTCCRATSGTRSTRAGCARSTTTPSARRARDSGSTRTSSGTSLSCCTTSRAR
jgi:hypothetical protein